MNKPQECCDIVSHSDSMILLGQRGGGPWCLGSEPHPAPPVGIELLEPLTFLTLTVTKTCANIATGGRSTEEDSAQFSQDLFHKIVNF